MIESSQPKKKKKKNDMIESYPSMDYGAWTHPLTYGQGPG